MYPKISKGINKIFNAKGFIPWVLFLILLSIFFEVLFADDVIHNNL